MRRARRSALWIVLLSLAASVAACSKDETSSSVIPGKTTGAGMSIGFKTASDPAASGDNAVEVTVLKDGKPVTDATVTTDFTMPAMPAMNMPEMKSTATLEHKGDGRYAGVGQLSMAGTWNVLVKVTRGGEELGTQSLSVVAK